LTNYTRALNIGIKSSNSLARYQEAASFLKKFKHQINEKKLIELHRQPLISTLYYNVWTNIHSAIFNSNTLDFWIAVDTPKASLGRWIGFNLTNELYPNGAARDIIIIPPLN